MAEGAPEEAPAKIGAIPFRVHGLLDRMLAAVKHLSTLIRVMESRSARGPPDYEMGSRPGIYVDYRGGSPAPTREPSWQGYLAKIVAGVIVAGLGSLIWELSAINSRLSTIEANQIGGNKLITLRLDEQEKHLEAHDKRLDEVDREIWTRKH